VLIQSTYKDPSDSSITGSLCCANLKKEENTGAWSQTHAANLSAKHLSSVIVPFSWHDEVMSGKHPGLVLRKKGGCN